MEEVAELPCEFLRPRSESTSLLAVDMPPIIVAGSPVSPLLPLQLK